MIKIAALVLPLLFEGASPIMLVPGGSGSAFTGGTLTGPLIEAKGTIAADDTTPAVNGGNYFVTSANTGATAITDLDLPAANQHVIICGGSNTNSSTIADSGNFNLSSSMVLGLDLCIGLRVQADNDYVEEWRTPDANISQVYTATATLNATNIVGSDSGDLNHAEGVLLVAAVSGKRIRLVDAVARYTRDTASYTGGGNTGFYYYDGSTQLQVSEVTTASSLINANSNAAVIFTPNDTSTSATASTIGINQKLIMWAASAYTQPGTAAGTASVTVYYQLVSD